MRITGILIAVTFVFAISQTVVAEQWEPVTKGDGFQIFKDKDYPGPKIRLKASVNDFGPNEGPSFTRAVRAAKKTIMDRYLPQGAVLERLTPSRPGRIVDRNTGGMVMLDAEYIIAPPVPPATRPPQPAPAPSYNNGSGGRRPAVPPQRIQRRGNPVLACSSNSCRI